ncbi:MAG TPA: hypothetical protein VG538_05520 [Vicinamibacterales bacterium]|nr:hypothetical protein [Vicinamibacterales bacterium]
MRTILMIAIVCGVVLTAFGQPVRAQAPAGAPDAAAGDAAPPQTAPDNVRTERPYRGIFRSGVDDAGQLLTTSISLGGGYSNDRLSRPVGETTGGLPPTFTGPFSAASGDVSYALDRDRVTFNASAGASARYYESRHDVLPGYSAAAGGSALLTRRLTLSGNLTGVVQPLYGLTLFPDAIAADPGTISPIDYTQDVASGAYRSVDGTAALDYALSERTGAELYYEDSRGELGDEHRNQTLRGAGASIHRQLTRDLGVKIGYARRLGTYDLADGSRTIRNDSIDAGIDYSHALSISRHTSLAFSTGTTAISDGDTTLFRIIGHATLDRQIGRTWDAALTYSRDVGFIKTLVEPTFSDSLAMAVGGLIGRRVELRTQIAATVGHLGFNQGDAATGFDAYDGTAQLTIALSRNLAMSASYNYYRYTFDTGAPLSGAVFRQLDRQSVQAGLQLWAPLLHRVRRPHAAR